MANHGVTEMRALFVIACVVAFGVLGGVIAAMFGASDTAIEITTIVCAVGGGVFAEVTTS